ncbi:GPW/gp25 family protein [Citrobacter portucalensis]|uniref:GPW/gp25 family protein n=1 Tax=Citrobacter portucalensis TaxID=1639133 RepID=UPI00226B6EAE|nr:GPW/gp25 family protein [Citrobacter portucalensis]MCX9039373.1 GPW/gp25 family protein [Citrobacter portucalensis]
MNTSTSAYPVYWQPALGTEGRVSGIDDISQSILIILGTPRGSDPLRPEFGSDLNRYIDWPVDRALPHVIRESVEAIRRWELRCQLDRIEPVIDGEHLTLRVHWSVSRIAYSTEVPWR